MPLAQAPKTRPERAGHRREEAARGTARRRGLGDRRVRPGSTLVPPLGGVGTAVEGEHTRAAEAELAVQLEREPLGVDVRVAGHQSRVVLRRREQVAGAEVAGLDALAPRDPGRREQRAGAGQQHDLVDRHLVEAVGARDGDRPAPAGVRLVRRRERVRHHALLLDLQPEVLPDRGPGHLDGRRAGEVHGVGALRVRGESGGRHGGGLLGCGGGRLGRRRGWGRLSTLVARSGEHAGYLLPDVQQPSSHTWHTRSLPDSSPGTALDRLGAPMTSRRRLIAAASAALALAALTGCEKPAPLVTVVSGGESVYSEAAVFCFEEGQTLQSKQCAKRATKAPRLAVREGERIGIDVDEELKDRGWRLQIVDPADPEPPAARRRSPTTTCRSPPRGSLPGARCC
jgi:hypothetical protein